MAYKHLPKNLPALLRKHGLRVVEVDGWYGRGRPSSTGGFAPVGVLAHHTASSAEGVDALRILIHGRSDLPGPLCQIALGRDGTVYLVASGRANHAGAAKRSGTVTSGDGNSLYIGIEAMNRGTGEKWPRAQYDAYVTLCAALSIEVTGSSHYTVRAHKETSKTGKIDPFGPTPFEASFDMGKFRSRVKSKMAAMKAAVKAAPKPTPVNEVFSVLSWNVENSGDHAADRVALMKILDSHDPDMVCIQEAYKIDLQDIPGYREVYHATKGYSTNSENRAQAVLVRDGLSVRIKQPIAMKLSWIGPKMAVKHSPRVHRYVAVKKGKTYWRVSSWHVPFGKKPVEETRLAAVAWLKSKGRVGPAIAVGDWNALANELAKNVATPAGATADGGGKDRAVFKGCSKVKGQNLGDQDRSDHDIKIWTFKK